nr:hypothetical protein [uncultured Dethiosulfovibrio sp.]
MCLGNLFGSTPEVKSVAPPEKVQAADDGKASASNVESQRRKLAGRQGYQSTILTGGQGASGQANISRPGTGSTILGGIGSKNKLGQ